MTIIKHQISILKVLTSTVNRDKTFMSSSGTNLIAAVNSSLINDKHLEERS